MVPSEFVENLLICTMNILLPSFNSVLITHEPVDLHFGHVKSESTSSVDWDKIAVLGIVCAYAWLVAAFSYLQLRQTTELFS